MAKSGKLEVGGNILQTLGPIGLPSTTVTKLARKAIEFGEKKRKIRVVTPFIVIQGHRGRYQSKACMRLLISD